MYPTQQYTIQHPAQLNNGTGKET